MNATATVTGDIVFDPFEAVPRSSLAFPDGARGRIEIPSVEGPRCFDAVLNEAAKLDVPVVRVSQGSGVGMLTDAEIRAMVELGADTGVEVSLFARPGAAWGPSAMTWSGAGAASAPSARGNEQLVAALDQIRRAADLGIRSVLISDVGVLAAFSDLRGTGKLPANMIAKTSVMLPVANGAAAAVMESLGAGTINVTTDLTVAHLAEIRSATPLPLDVYVEVPDNVGGFVRHHEIGWIASAAAPVYIKFGLRNAPDVYPSGSHLDALTVDLVRARVRRSRLGLDEVERGGHDLSLSQRHATGLAIPVA